MFAELLTKAQRKPVNSIPKADSKMLATIAEVNPSIFSHKDNLQLGDEPLTEKEYTFLKQTLHSFREIN